MHVGASPTTFVKAKYLRANLTPSERLLWKFLSNKQMEGVKFRQQHPLDIYVIDFYSHELRGLRLTEIIIMRDLNLLKMKTVI